MRELNNDQDQIEFLKEIWRDYGRVVVFGIVLGLVLMYGWRYFQKSHQHYAQQASTLYEQVLTSFNQRDNEIVNTQVDLLKKEYAKTPYAALGVLMQARIAVEANDMTKAKDHLQWVLDHAKDDAAKQIARIRLARIALANKQYDEGLALLSVNDYPGFDIYTNEVKGDIFYAKGDMDAARGAYQQAINDAGELPVGGLIDMKLANLTTSPT